MSEVSVPVTAFRHQYDFYRSLGLRIEFFGHPLAERYRMRALRPAAPTDGGTVAMLPGSRSGELRRHVPAMAAAYRTLQQRRPHLRGVFGVADDRGERMIRDAIAGERLSRVDIARGVEAAVAEADGAWVSSGTATLECALLGVPCVGIYIIPPILIRYGHRMIRHHYIMLPNLVLGREVIPELLQEKATPEALADALESEIEHPVRQYEAFVQMREALGAPDALKRCASYAVELARGS